MGNEILKETPDFARGDGTFFFLGDRMVVPITTTDVERYNLKNPYQDRGGESPDILGMSGMVMTPSDVKRCHARWVKAGAPTPRFFSNVLKCVLSLQEGWNKIQKSDYSTIDNLTNEKSELEKLLAEFKTLDTKFDELLYGTENSKKAKPQKSEDLDALSVDLRKLLPNLNRTMVRYSQWHFETLSFWQRLKLFFGYAPSS